MTWSALLLERFEQIWGPLTRDNQNALRHLTKPQLTTFRDVLIRDRHIP